MGANGTAVVEQRRSCRAWRQQLSLNGKTGGGIAVFRGIWRVESPSKLSDNARPHHVTSITNREATL
jgi:hypothetical protein